MPPPLSPKRAPGASAPCSSIKHRRLAPQGERPWASLPEDLVQLIGWRVLAGDLLDYVRLRAVCAHWNRSTVRPRGRGLIDPRFHPRRWMLLPEGHGLYPGHPHLGGYVRFFNLSTGVFVRVHLPLFHDHIVFHSVDGLLLLLLHRDHCTDVRLLHPFTGDIAELPPLLPLVTHASHPKTSDVDKLRRLLSFQGLSAAVTVSGARTITVMLVNFGAHVAHAAAGDECWTLSAWKLPMFKSPAVFFQGKMYMVSPLFMEGARYLREKKGVCIYQFDPPQLNLPPRRPKMIAKCPQLVGNPGALIQLVECGSELMLVGCPKDDASGADILVYRVADLVCGITAPVKDIGDHALFLGDHRNICVSANKEFPSVQRNSITCRHMSTIQNLQVGTRRKRDEQYHLHTGTWSVLGEDTVTAAVDEGIPGGESLASPYNLDRHIYTCCYHKYWNNGVIFGGATTPDWSAKPNFWPGLHLMKSPRQPTRQPFSRARAVGLLEPGGPGQAAPEELNTTDGASSRRAGTGSAPGLPAS